MPALRALRRRWPDAPVRLAAQPRLGALLAALGVVDDCVAFDTLGIEALFVDDGSPAPVEAVRAAGRVVCWFGARDPVFVRRLAAIAPSARVASPAPAAGATVWEGLLASVEAPVEGREPMPVPPALEAEGRRALVAAGWDGATPLLMVHPGAGGLAKRWPAEGFARVLEDVTAAASVAAVVHEGPADSDAVAALAGRLRRPPIVLRDPPLPALAGALRAVRAYVGSDSGVSHLAAAVGAAAAVLFSPPNLAWRPWSPSARVVTVSTAGVETIDITAVTDAVSVLLAA